MRAVRDRPARPVLLRIPWSHYCKKAEWALSLRGVPYDTLDVTIGKMAIVRTIPPEGKVPILRTEDGLLPGSDQIARFADRHGEHGPLLVPPRRADVEAWERWCDTNIGPQVRLEAYRQLYDDPRAYARHWWWRPILRLARPQVLLVLKAYKARRTQSSDPPILRAAIKRAAAKLRQSGTGFLFLEHPTIADVATAALLEPLGPIAEVRGYAGEDWDEVSRFIDRVRPPLRRVRRRFARRSEVERWRTLPLLPTP